MYDSYRLRDNLESLLDGIREEMLRKKKEDRISFLKIEIQKWEQKVLGDRVQFRRLLQEGELNIDPEVFENELDEEELAIGRIYLWINAMESGNDIFESDSKMEDKGDIQDENTLTFEPDPTNQYMDIHQVAKYLQVSESYIYRLSSEGEIPRIKMGNLIRFDKDEIDKWMRRKRG
ncbi:MAG: helix-turn-helix domain-containing protein [Spirochaetales bacterium]|nr:helix-turn-helix domain-containing protein [Spirochaetales bacterium]